MAEPSPSIIRKIVVCDEHRCKIFAEMRVMERVASKELEIKVESSKRKKTPKRDRSGRLCTINENYLIIDPKFQTTDPRHTVAKTHRHITDTGEAGMSGKHDPKSITSPDGTARYLIFPYKNSVCELCEGGDMISPWRRFTDSEYHPGERVWHRVYLKARAWFHAIIRA